MNFYSFTQTAAGIQALLNKIGTIETSIVTIQNEIQNLPVNDFTMNSKNLNDIDDGIIFVQANLTSNIPSDCGSSGNKLVVIQNSFTSSGGQYYTTQFCSGYNSNINFSQAIWKRTKSNNTWSSWVNLTDKFNYVLENVDSLYNVIDGGRPSTPRSFIVDGGHPAQRQ